MSPFLRGGKEGRKGSGAVGWRGKRWAASRATGSGAAGKPRPAGRGRGCFGWSFQSDFTNEMGIYCQTDRGGNNGHPALCFLKLPSVAISPWVFDHFISEMSDRKQQRKNPRPRPAGSGFPAAPLPVARLAAHRFPRHPTAPLPFRPSSPPRKNGLLRLLKKNLSILNIKKE